VVQLGVSVVLKCGTLSLGNRYPLFRDVVCNFMNLEVQTVVPSQNIDHQSSRVIVACPGTETIPRARTNI